MVDGVLVWAKRQRDEWTRSLGQLESGALGTWEVRYGERIDTSAETIADLSKRIAELEALIDKHEPPYA